MGGQETIGEVAGGGSVVSTLRSALMPPDGAPAGSRSACRLGAGTGQGTRVLLVLISHQSLRKQAFPGNRSKPLGRQCLWVSPDFGGTLGRAGARTQPAGTVSV